MKPLCLAVALALLALAGCGRSTPAAPTAAPADVDVTALARAAFQRGDWAAAAPLLRQALGKEPGSLELHYYLAITDTYLDLSDAAEQEFKWVLANARAGSEEAETARRWLAERGGVRNARDAAAVDNSATGTSGLSGQVNWPDGPVQTARLQLFLKGIPGTPTAASQYVRRADDQGRFEFSKIPPGSYKLTNRIAGRPVWRLRVQIPPDETVKLDLGPQNSLSARDDFPKDDT